MEKLRLSLEAYSRASMIGKAQIVIDMADNGDQLKLVVYYKNDNVTNTNRLKDVTSYIDRHFKDNEFKYLDKGSEKDPLQVVGDKYFMKNIINSKILGDLEYLITEYK